MDWNTSGGESGNMVFVTLLMVIGISTVIVVPSICFVLFLRYIIGAPWDTSILWLAVILLLTYIKFRVNNAYK